MLFGLSPFDLIGILIFVILIFFLPSIMRSRIISSVNKVVMEMEEIVKESHEMVINISKEKGNPSEDPHESIARFMDFFIIPPVNLDPHDIVKKFEKILELGEERFEEMGEIIAPEASSEDKSNIIMTLKATIGLHTINKMVRHNLELARKTGNLQLLIGLQMNLPLIMRLFKAQFEGAKAFSNGYPVGDGIGPLIAGILMNDITPELHEEDLEYPEDMVLLNSEFKHREITILRAKGPGGRIGKLGKVVTNIIDKEHITRIITVDASAKLEGEKTGQIAEGIGVAIGGLGVEKWLIEEKIISNNIKIDAIIVKMSPEEAIKQMTPEILNSTSEALKILKKSILRSPENSHILIVGVGNSCGIPNINIDQSQIQVSKTSKINDSKEKDSN